MATQAQADQALVDAIAAAATQYADPKSLLLLAEASAWLKKSAQPHGGHCFLEKK